MQAAQQAQMAAQQASQQAMSDMQMASQNATNAMNAAQQQAMSNSQCVSPTPSFSVKTGAYSSALTVTITASRRAAIFYTTDGWTPTNASTRYTVPITIDSSTTLQAIAISPCSGRSRVSAAIYTLTGVSPAPSSSQNVTVLHAAVPTISNAAAAAAASGKLFLPQGTAVPLVFASDVNSKTAHVGDKISLTLAQDLKAGDAVVARKGTVSFATITQVDKPHVFGGPGEVYFKADYLQADGTVIKLRGSAAKEGQDEASKAAALMVVPLPVGLLVHGKDVEIKPGAQFTAFVDADTVLPPN